MFMHWCFRDLQTALNLSIVDMISLEGCWISVIAPVTEDDKQEE